MSIRFRIALGIVIVTLALLGGAAVGLHQYLDRSMIATVDSSLQGRADDLNGLVQRTDAGELELGERRVTDSDESYVLVQDARGRVLAESRELDDDADDDDGEGDDPDPSLRVSAPGNLPDDGELRTRILDGDSLRVLELPSTTADDTEVTLVVAESLDRHDDTLASLRTALLIGVPIIALLLMAAAIAQLQRPLRAVERVRRQAAAYEADGASERIDVPGGSDEITRLAHTVNEMLERIDRAVGQQRRFVASASHELRTPLTILKAEVEAAMTLPADEVHSTLARLDDEIDRISLLTDGLLVVAEQERDELRANRTPIDLVDIADAVAERYRDRADRAERAIEVHEADSNVGHGVEGDRVLLEQALANLVDNSLRHGAGTIRIDIAARDGLCTMRVSDSGEGIPEEVSRAGFEPFTRGAGSGGSGLGLSIVRAIASAHAGRVDVIDRFVTIGIPS